MLLYRSILSSFGFLCVSTIALAQAPSPKVTNPQSVASGSSKWTVFGSLRLRTESWSWFGTPLANGTYTYLASVFRFGLRRDTQLNETVLELSNPTLLGLPDSAVAPAPQGQLGLGATYRANSGGQTSNLFVKQAYWRPKALGGGANSLKLGRFEFAEGVERPSKDPTIAAIKRERIGHRLIGPFVFTHIGRSFDGVHFTADSPQTNSTLAAFFPTRGVFSPKGNDTLTNVRVAYAGRTSARTTPTSEMEARLFGIYYEDGRNVVKGDNRPLVARGADTNSIRIWTAGGHLVGTKRTGSVSWDGLLWGAGQSGRWGNLSHGAFAMAMEGGVQFSNLMWRPWLRLGYYHASGDDDPGNGRHGTFFPMLPTPRIYARFPFFSESNLNDLFAELTLRPNKRLSVRMDAHALSLADPADLWYLGGGAFDNSSFGFPARPSGGTRGLATLVDISADYQIDPLSSVGAYFAYARGGSVVTNLFPGKSASLFFVEFNRKF